MIKTNYRSAIFAFENMHHCSPNYLQIRPRPTFAYIFVVEFKLRLYALLYLLPTNRMRAYYFKNFTAAVRHFPAQKRFPESSMIIATTIIIYTGGLTVRHISATSISKCLFNKFVTRYVTYFTPFLRSTVLTVAIIIFVSSHRLRCVT